MFSVKMIISKLLVNRSIASWCKVKFNLTQSAAKFSSSHQTEATNADINSHGSSQIPSGGVSNSNGNVDQIKLTDPEEVNQYKSTVYGAITSSVLEESFAKQEEKYQHKVSEIIEIFYSLDEGDRPELKAIDIDYMVKMDKPRQIKTFLKRLHSDQVKFKSFADYKQNIREFLMSKPKPECGVVFDSETGSPVYKMHNIAPVCCYEVVKRMRSAKYARLIQAKLLGTQKIIIDFDYDQHMTVKQHTTITAQAKICVGILKGLAEPVELYFCNYKPESPSARYLEVDFGSLSDHMVEATSQSYLDLFPKERLVYLTADTDDVLKYNPDDIYIIGGMIDALTNEPLSALKAQREGLRTAKLPLDEHIKLRNEVKSLKIGQVFGIMCQIASNNNNNIKEALEKYISPRIKTDEEVDRKRRKLEADRERFRQLFKDKYSLSDEEVEAMILCSMYYNKPKNQQR